MTVTVRAQKVYQKPILVFEANTWITKGNPWLVRNLGTNLPARLRRRMELLFELRETIKMALFSATWYEFVIDHNGALPRYWRISVYMKKYGYMIDAEGGNVWHGLIYIFPDKETVVIESIGYFNSACAVEVLLLVLEAISHYLALSDP